MVLILASDAEVSGCGVHACERDTHTVLRFSGINLPCNPYM